KRRGKVTLYPSVWRESGCLSHFVVWDNRILLFDDSEFAPQADSEIRERVFALLNRNPNKYFHFLEIADQLDELPWSVLVICRDLASTGRLQRLPPPDDANFARVLK